MAHPRLTQLLILLYCIIHLACSQEFYLNNSYQSTSSGTQSAPFTTLEDAFEGISSYIATNPNKKITLFIAATPQPYLLKTQLTLEGDLTQNLTIKGIFNTSSVNITVDDPFSTPPEEQSDLALGLPNYCSELFPQIIVEADINAGSLKLASFIQTQIQHVYLQVISKSFETFPAPIIEFVPNRLDTSVTLVDICASVVSNLPWVLFLAEDFSALGVSNLQVNFFQAFDESLSSSSIIAATSGFDHQISITNAFIYLAPTQPDNPSRGTVRLIRDDDQDFTSRISINRFFSQAFVPQFDVTASSFTMRNTLLNFYQTSTNIAFQTNGTLLEMTQIREVSNFTIENFTLVGLRANYGMIIFFSTDDTPTVSNITNITFYDNLFPCMRLLGLISAMQSTLNGVIIKNSTFDFQNCSDFAVPIMSIGEKLETGGLFVFVRRATEIAGLIETGVLNNEVPNDVGTRVNNVQIYNSSLYNAEFFSLKLRNQVSSNTNLTFEQHMLLYYELSSSFRNVIVQQTMLSDSSTLFASPFAGVFFSSVEFKRNSMGDRSKFAHLSGSQSSFILESSSFLENNIHGGSSYVLIEDAYHSSSTSITYISRMQAFQLVQIRSTVFINDTVEESQVLSFSNVFAVNFDNCQIKPKMLSNCMGFVEVISSLQFTEFLPRENLTNLALTNTVWNWTQRVTDLQTQAINASITSKNRVWDQHPEEKAENPIPSDKYNEYYLLPVLFNNVRFWDTDLTASMLLNINDLCEYGGVTILNNVAIGNLDLMYFQSTTLPIFRFLRVSTFTMMNSLVTANEGSAKLFAIDHVKSISLSPNNTWNLLYNRSSYQVDKSLIKEDSIHLLYNHINLGRGDPSNTTLPCGTEGVKNEQISIFSEEITNLIISENTFTNINLAESFISITAFRISGSIEITSNLFSSIDLTPCILWDRTADVILIQINLFYTIVDSTTSNVSLINNRFEEIRVYSETEFIDVIGNDLILIVAPRLPIIFQHNTFQNVTMMTDHGNLLQLVTTYRVEISNNSFSTVYKGNYPLISLSCPSASILNNNFSHIISNLTTHAEYSLFKLASPINDNDLQPMKVGSHFHLNLTGNIFDTIFLSKSAVLSAELLIMNISADSNTFTHIFTSPSGCMLCFSECEFNEFRLSNTNFNNLPNSSKGSHHSRLLEEEDINDIGLDIASVAEILDIYTNFLNIEQANSGSLTVDEFFTNIPVLSAPSTISELIFSRITGVLFALTDLGPDFNVSFSNIVINYTMTPASPAVEKYDLKKLFSFLSADSGSYSLVNSSFQNIVFYSSSLINVLLDVAFDSSFEIINCNFSNFTFHKSDIYQIEEKLALSVYTTISVANGLLSYDDTNFGVFKFAAVVTTTSQGALTDFNLTIKGSEFRKIDFGDKKNTSYQGSSVYITAGAGKTNVDVDNCTFANITSHSGPAINSLVQETNGGPAAISTSIQIMNTLFLGNVAQFTAGAVYNTFSHIWIGNSTFQENKALSGRTSTIFTSTLIQWPNNSYINNSGIATDHELDKQICPSRNFSNESSQNLPSLNDSFLNDSFKLPANLPEKQCGISLYPTAAIMFVNHTYDGIFTRQGPLDNLTNVSSDFFNSHHIVIYIKDNDGRLFYETSRPTIKFYANSVVSRLYDCSLANAELGVYTCNFTKGFQYALYSGTNNVTIEYISKNFGRFTISMSVTIRNCTSGEVKQKRANSQEFTCRRCPMGTFSLDPETETTCRTCLEYASCPGGHHIAVYENYSIYHPDENNASNVTVKLCPNPDTCKGGVNSACLKGYKGELCQACDLSSNFIAYGDGCSECNDLGWGITVLIVTIMGIFGYQVYYIWSTYTTNTEIAKLRSIGALTESLALEHQGGVYVRLLTTYSQIISVVYALRYQIVRDIGLATSVVGSPSRTVIYSSICVFVLDSVFNKENILYYNMLMINILPLIKILVIWLAIAIIHRQSMDKKHIWAIMLLAANCILLVEQPGAFKQLINYFDCERIDQTTYVHQMTGTICHDSAYNKFLGWIIAPSLFFWGALVPISFFARLYSIRDNLGDKVNCLTYGAMYIGYKDKAYWWEVMMLVVKILINLAAEFFKQNYNMLALTAFLVLFGYYVIFDHILPHETQKLNNDEKLTFRTYMITTFAMVTYYNQESGGSGVGKFAAIVIVVLANVYTMWKILKNIIRSNLPYLIKAKNFCVESYHNAVKRIRRFANRSRVVPNRTMISESTLDIGSPEL